MQMQMPKPKRKPKAEPAASWALGKIKNESPLPSLLLSNCVLVMLTNAS